MIHLLGRLAAALVLLTLSLPAAAQDRPNTILVLDGSGSMWGQIDGVNKIVIARQVVGDLLGTLPEDLNLGLTVYGHRRKGDCSDIETVVTPGPGTRAAISSAVNAIRPLGKTPMTDALIAAAQALRYTEEAATVILVSDGVETCNPDPCAAARALEEAGVNFTAHVVGFDVSDPAALLQMQCVADATGGQFLTAADAAALAEALTRVATAMVPPAPAAPPAPPAEIRARIAVTETFGEASRTVEGGIRVEILADGGLVTAPETDGARAEAVLPAGDYVLRVLRLSDEAVIERPFTMEDADVALAVVFDAPLPPATLEAPATAPAGATVAVTWTGPNAEGDYIDTARVDAPSLEYETYAYTADGTPAQLRMPAQPGDYVIRYILAEGYQELASIPVTVTPVEQGLTAPDAGVIGEVIPVDWQGGGFDEDYIAVAPVGSDSGTYVTYSYVSGGNPVPVKLPLTPGAYELRYITGQDTTIAEARPITVADAPVTLEAADRVAAGAELSVTWTGPGYPEDYLTIADPADGDLGYVTYAYTEGGSPLVMTAPDTPGTYELRYVASGADSRALARRVLVVE
jgi:Ca-activated chloride channel family protein